MCKANIAANKYETPQGTILLMWFIHTHISVHANIMQN